MSTLTRSIAAAGVLVVPVLTEIAWSAFSDSWWGDAVFSCSQLLGWALLYGVCRDLRAATRPLGRFGATTALVGCAFQMLFALVYGVSALSTGEPFGLVFGLFLLGFLALGVGGLTWAAALARASVQRVAAVGLALTGLGGLGAVAIGIDPWHDIALVGGYLAWIVVGAGLSQVPKPTATFPDSANQLPRLPHSGR